MITGANMSEIKPKSTTYGILSNLIKLVLKQPFKGTFDEYVIDIFYAFCQHKKQIILDLYPLNKGNAEMNGLIMSTLDKRYADEEKKRESGDVSNLFLPDLLRIFPNV